MSDLEIIILAAGKGTRMRSAQSKVLHKLAGKSMIAHVTDSVRQLHPKKMHIVTGHQKQQVEQHLTAYQQQQHMDIPIHFVEQQQQLGTAHAIKQVLPHLHPSSIVLIVYGDVPLIATSSLQRLIRHTKQDAQNSIALMTVHLPDPSGYGRIVRCVADAPRHKNDVQQETQKEQGKVIAIIEDKEADANTRAIKEINTSIMAVSAAVLSDFIPKINNHNSKGEFYLTDIISLAVQQGGNIATEHPDSPLEVQGVNSFPQLAELERAYQHKQAMHLMQSGVHLADPSRFDLRGKLQHDQDVFIDANVILEGDVTLGKDVVIEAQCIIKNSKIGDGCHIRANSIIEGAHLASTCTVGPFARIRPGTRLADQVRIGNFVETKNADIAEGAKVNHLAYMGDIAIGRHTNIGAGAIHCNFDGKNKHYSRIGDHSFIGSNTAIIGPVHIGSESLLAAGSVINKDVPDQTMAIARKQQEIIQKKKKSP